MGFGGKVGKNTPLMLFCLPVAHGAFSENSVFFFFFPSRYKPVRSWAEEKLECEILQWTLNILSSNNKCLALF